MKYACVYAHACLACKPIKFRPSYCACVSGEPMNCSYWFVWIYEVKLTVPSRAPESRYPGIPGSLVQQFQSFRLSWTFHRTYIRDFQQRQQRIRHGTGFYLRFYTTDDQTTEIIVSFIFMNLLTLMNFPVNRVSRVEGQVSYVSVLSSSETS